MKKLLLIFMFAIGLCILFAGIVQAVGVDNQYYSIDCTPDNAYIQANGFNQLCSYTWKGANPLSEDVAFCFDSQLVSGHLYYYNNGWQDINNLFTFIHYPMAKGYCYYVRDVVFLPNTPIVTWINYMPKISGTPKWDTYFGNITAQRIDLKLDPVYNTSLYKIGTQDSSSYYWKSGSNWNNDILTAGVWGFNNNITNYLNFRITNTSLSDLDSIGQESGSTPYKYDEIVTLENRTVASTIVMYCKKSGVYGRLIYLVFNYTDGSASQSSTIDITSSSFTRYEFNTTQPFLDGYIFRSHTDSNNNVGVIDCNNRTIVANTSFTNTLINKSDGVVISKSIALPILVQSYSINATYTGSAAINISFDGSNFFYRNLSNTSVMLLTDSSNDNTNLTYKLYLLNNATTIYNLSINFNGMFSNLSIKIYNESNGAILSGVNTTLQFYGSDGSYYITTVNGAGNISNLQLINYSIKASAPGYSTKYYYFDMNQNYYELHMYLLPSANSDNVSFTFYNVNGAVIEGVLLQEYLSISGSYVLMDSLYSDISGVVYLPYDPSYSYLYSYSKAGYKSVNFSLASPRAPNYDITLSYDTVYVSHVPKAVVGSYSYNNVTKILLFSYTSTDDTITNYSYTVSKVVDSRNIVLCSGSDTILTKTFNCDLYGYSGVMYVQGVADNEEIFYGAYLDVPGLPTLFSNLTPAEAAFLTGLILSIIVFGGLIFGVPGTLLMGGVGLYLLYLLKIFTVLSVTFVIVDIVVSIIIILGLKRR